VVTVLPVRPPSSLWMRTTFGKNSAPAWYSILANRSPVVGSTTTPVRPISPVPGKSAYGFQFSRFLAYTPTFRSPRTTLMVPYSSVT
jgi:hypothetical protein